MTFQRKTLGASGEDIALEYLKQKGCRLVGRNIKLYCGEIDLLMTDKNFLVIVEVKTKSDDRFGLPQEMVNLKKKKKLIQLAKVLAQKYPDKPIRIDVVAIDNSKTKTEHFINAVEELGD